MIKPYYEYGTIYLDVDDTLIKTTLTLDQYSKHPIIPVHPSQGRWEDFIDVIQYYDQPIKIPLYEGVEELFDLLKSQQVKVISAAPDINYSRQNRVNAIGHLTDIQFFDSDLDKIEFLKSTVDRDDLVVDDKYLVLNDITCYTILINKELNNTMSIQELVNYWRC
jgi:hypothetical protein